MRRILAFLLTLLSGCTTIEAGDSRHRTMTFVGVVRVRLDDDDTKLSAVDVKMLGVGWDAGPFIGWQAGTWVRADPSHCQLLIVIRTPAQADNAEKVLRALGGQNACVADYTRPPPP